MSSIIDALKKSDQNRNGDSEATVNQINFSENPAPKSRRGFWLLVGFLLLVALGAYAWKQGWHHSLMEQVNTWTQSTEATNTAETTVQQAKTTETEPTVVAQSDEKQADNNKLIPPKQSEIKTASIEQEKARQQNKATVQNPTVEAAPQQKAKPTVTKKDQTVAEAKPVTQPTTKPVKKQRKDKGDGNKKALQPRLQQDYLLLHQIDYAIRKNIPPIKVSIHIYDPDPDNRMVLINGDRYNVGDSIESTLTIEEIVKEGIVVSYENIKFLIPK